MVNLKQLVHAYNVTLSFSLCTLTSLSAVTQAVDPEQGALTYETDRRNICTLVKLVKARYMLQQQLAFALPKILRSSACLQSAAPDALSLSVWHTLQQ